MKKETLDTVYLLLKNFTQKSIKSFDVEKLKSAYPFHRLFFDELSLIAFKQERSIVTKMGMHLYPELAKIIALENFRDVTRETHIRGTVPLQTATTIDRIVTELRTNQRAPNRENETREIEESFTQPNNVAFTEIRTVADIYIGDFTGGPFFAEIKTPLPNLDICAETKKKILTFKAVRRGQNPKAFMAFPYNPFVTRAEYKHGFTNRIMDISNDVLMGDEFWDYIGGPGTFTTILGIIEIVGNEIRSSNELKKSTNKNKA